MLCVQGEYMMGISIPCQYHVHAHVKCMLHVARQRTTRRLTARPLTDATLPSLMKAMNSAVMLASTRWSMDWMDASCRAVRGTQSGCTHPPTHARAPT